MGSSVLACLCRLYCSIHITIYREKKFFVGSGVVEAGCRTVIGERLKQSGMRWSVRGANAIIALHCCILSGRFEDFWASRTS